VSFDVRFVAQDGSYWLYQIPFIRAVLVGKWRAENYRQLRFRAFDSRFSPDAPMRVCAKVLYDSVMTARKGEYLFYDKRYDVLRRRY